MGTVTNKRQQRRNEAEVRQAKYDSLTLAEKLAKAGAKEKAKLLKKSQK